MAVPAPVIPSGNSYSLHFAGTPPVLAAATAALLQSHKVAIRQHVTGDGAEATRTRAFLEPAGAKASAFSPAPAGTPEVPGEGFWKATAVVVQAAPGKEAAPWWLDRADRKVDWDCLLVAVSSGSAPGDFSAAELRAPDLWLVRNAGTPQDWLRAGAGAAAIASNAGIAWASRNAAFGNSQGSLAVEKSGSDAFGYFGGGVLCGLIEELLGENLFDKTVIRVDRDDLEIRPLRLGRACMSGRAAWAAAADAPAEALLHKKGALLGGVRDHLRKEASAEETAKPWGARGR